MSATAFEDEGANAMDRLTAPSTLTRWLSSRLLVVLLAALPLPGEVRAAEPPQADSVLARLIDEALEARPELAQARAEAQAARERVPQAEALPDPMLQVGVQNDGFDKWSVGRMETSWVLFMASQTFPFPGKLGLRGEIAATDARQRELATERTRLTTVADVRRAYVALQLARARLELLAKLMTLFNQAAGVAKARYESGEGPQSDLLRAHLEVARLSQQRRVAEADEVMQRQTLNRLRGKPLALPISLDRGLAGLRFPAPPDEAAELQRFREQSPELLAAGVGKARAERTKSLGERSYLPDLSVGAGVMVRGALDPMWTVTLGVPLPVFAGAKQSRAVAEAGALVAAASSGIETVEQLAVLRVGQRLEYWRALQEVWRTYQDGLLGDAEATAESTLAQYRVGKVPFAAVLEANTAAITIVDASYAVLADGWRLAIAEDELSLAETSVGATPMGGSISGSGGMSAPGRPSSAGGSDTSAGPSTNAPNGM